MSKRSIKDFFSVIQDEIVDLTMKKVSCSTVLPDHAVKPLLHIHKEKEITVESVIDQFAQHKERRLALCL